MNCDHIILIAIACPDPSSKACDDVDVFLKRRLLEVWISIGWSSVLPQIVPILPTFQGSDIYI